ncbi:MAG: 2-oxo acid dehydrogenase subunit E2 [Saprospiraceae bacterium]|nr:2-oxo acid dehydrogenase subunit E2 [Saprospiraceae bacterium]
MARVELIMPKMGESIMEATILKWSKKPGDSIAMDETVLEIATDKVDSEIPSPVAGTLVEILFPEEAVVEIGKVIAIIETESGQVAASPAVAEKQVVESAPAVKTEVAAPIATTTPVAEFSKTDDDRFYSPLVKSMAKQEGISSQELSRIVGTGAQGRVTKTDMIEYLKSKANAPVAPMPQQAAVSAPAAPTQNNQQISAPSTPAADYTSGNVEIIEMDRMRKLISDHMVMSKHTSPHVTSFVEADVTNMVQWRERNKKKFMEKYGENITFTPLFIEAVVKAIKDFPMINISLDGYKIIRKKDINIGMAAALPSGNLIVPVIKNADHLNLVGLTKMVNDLAGRARQNKLKPEEIKDGTFTVTNVGTFGNVMGTPIINQPQVAILATGSIKKKPAVIETEFGDVIAIRQMMFLSLSYDHRVVDGSLGGSFLRRIADNLENFDAHQSI